MIKKIEKEIKKIEQQRLDKIDKRNQIDEEIGVYNLRLKELNVLKNQYEKLEEHTNDFFEKK